MSVMSGLTTVKNLASNTLNEKAIHEMLECGAEGYLFKGCAVEDLLLKLRQLLLD